MAKMTLSDMKRMVEQAEELEDNYCEIPSGYLDRLNYATVLLDRFKKLPAINVDEIQDSEQLEKALAANDEREHLKLAMEQHFQACALTGPAKGTKNKKQAGRRTRRSSDEVAVEKERKQLYKAACERLGFAPQGKKSADQQAAIEKEIEKLKKNKK